MIEYLLNLSGWDWLAVAGVVFIIDMVLTSGYLMWLALAALVVGVLTLVAPALSWEWQYVIFAGLSVVLAPSLISSSKRRRAKEESHGGLNNRGMEMVGGTYEVAEDGIVNGRGRIRAGDSSWIAAGPDCVPGTKVKVTHREGTIVHVIRAEGA